MSVALAAVDSRAGGVFGGARIGASCVLGRIGVRARSVRGLLGIALAAVDSRARGVLS